MYDIVYARKAWLRNGDLDPAVAAYFVSRSFLRILDGAKEITEALQRPTSSRISQDAILTAHGPKQRVRGNKTAQRRRGERNVP